MREAQSILGLIRERGNKRAPLQRVYRLLYNPNLYLMAYGKIYRNQGAMTKGVTRETVDGMALWKIEQIIEALRQGRYHWHPTRRTFIPRKDGKQRPLGLPTWTDKLLQEVLRLILEAYYDPQMSPCSHGFRPGRGCHTALRCIAETWTGTVWFLEGDISKCFERLDHSVLLAILREHIHDERFIHLIETLLQAGYLEDWHWNATHSGVPQGSIIGPCLSNLYLNKLDQFVETVLIPEHTTGTKRKIEPVYDSLIHRAAYLRRTGRKAEARVVRKQAQQRPSVMLTDPTYRRLRYCRYADDFLLGFVGTKTEAELIKYRLRTFLQEELKLELSEAKTLITHARTHTARFLNYEIHTLHANSQRDQTGRRSLNGTIGLRVPREVLQQACRHYRRNGKKVCSRKELLNDSDFTIIALYQSQYRGLVEYYRLAYNLHCLSALEAVMKQSLTKTLARKHQISVRQVFKRYQAIHYLEEKPYKVLQVVIERAGKKPLIARWGAISLKWEKQAILYEQRELPRIGRSELEKRLLADRCEYCGATSETDPIEVHHIRALKDLHQYPGRDKPPWVKIMAARQRKTLIVCRTCHQDITYGRPMRRPKSAHGQMRLESRMH